MAQWGEAQPHHRDRQGRVDEEALRLPAQEDGPLRRAGRPRGVEEQGQALVVLGLPGEHGGVPRSAAPEVDQLVEGDQLGRPAGLLEDRLGCGVLLAVVVDPIVVVDGDDAAHRRVRPSQLCRRDQDVHRRHHRRGCRVGDDGLQIGLRHRALQWHAHRSSVRTGQVDHGLVGTGETENADQLAGLDVVTVVIAPGVDEPFDAVVQLGVRDRLEAREVLPDVAAGRGAHLIGAGAQGRSRRVPIEDHRDDLCERQLRPEASSLHRRIRHQPPQLWVVLRHLEHTLGKRRYGRRAYSHLDDLRLRS